MGQGALAMGLRAQSTEMGAWSLAKMIHGLPFSFDLNETTTQSNPPL